MSETRHVPSALIDAARFERDRRAASFPRLVADGKLNGENATTDYQCWCAIAEWLETGTCSAIGSWAGLAEPPVAVMSWPLIEQCATKQLAAIDASLLRLGSGGADKGEARHDTSDPDPAKLASLRDRRVTIGALVDRLAFMRESAERLHTIPRRPR